MPRAKDIPACPNVPVACSQVLVAREYEISLVTPMFGGGVEAERPDEGFPFRPTEIRGQLQFWWRATVGAQYETAKELREAQSEIWGSTERASKVEVRIKNANAENIQPCAEIRWNPQAGGGQGAWRISWRDPFNKRNSSLSYAIFPFQGETPPPQRNAQVTVPPANCVLKGNFRLVVTCPQNVWDQVEPALWAWINFGGLGARTRRGCGALYCRDFSPSEVDELFSSWRKHVRQEASPREWPTLVEKLLWDDSQSEPIRAWDKVIGLLKEFRQGVGIARNPGQGNRPGRSRWPEPEIIREATQQRCNRHQRLDRIPAYVFPRAEFGLPIVFHFKDRGDPDDTVLYPDGDRERMASPLILKPLALSENQAIPIILRLRTPDLERVVLKQGNNPVRLPETTAVQYSDSLLARPACGSALDAFLKYAVNKGFQEARL